MIHGMPVGRVLLSGSNYFTHTKEHTMANVEMLSRLVTWAATDYMRGTHPDEAVALGIAKEGDKRLGSWNQGAWSLARRNGTCQTAFCIAGGAVALDDEYVTVMINQGSGYKEDEFNWSGSHAAKKDRIPLGADLKWGYWWVSEEEADAVDFYDRSIDIGEAGRSILGLDDDDANYLFVGSNTIEQVVSLAQYFAQRDGKTLDVPVWVLERFNVVDVHKHYYS